MLKAVIGLYEAYIILAGGVGSVAGRALSFSRDNPWGPADSSLPSPPHLAL